jgi:hypothetical protein
MSLLPNPSPDLMSRNGVRAPARTTVERVGGRPAATGSGDTEREVSGKSITGTPPDRIGFAVAVATRAASAPLLKLRGGEWRGVALPALGLVDIEDDSSTEVTIDGRNPVGTTVPWWPLSRDWKVFEAPSACG